MAFNPIDPRAYIINAPSPAEGVMQGMAMAGQFNQMQAQREQQAALIAKAQADARMQEQFNAEVGQVYENPTPGAISKLMIKYPQHAKNWKEAYDALSSDQQREQVKSLSQVYAATVSGDIDTAKRLITEQADAAMNSGKQQDAQAAKAMLGILERDPNMAKVAVGSYLAGVVGPEKFAETYAKLGQEQREVEAFPVEMETKREGAKKAKSDAEKAAVVAKFAEAEAVQDLARKGWEIKKLENDIKVSGINTAIASERLKLDRETNLDRKQEHALKVKELEAKRDETVRAKTQEAEAFVSSIDGLLLNLNRALETPENIREASTGPIAGRLPAGAMTLGWNAREVTDFRATVETLKSQSALQALQALKAAGATLGQVAVKELEALERSWGNLSMEQSGSQLFNNMKSIQKRVLNLRKMGLDKYGMPDRPVGAGPAASGGPTFSLAEVNALAAERGVDPSVIRQQVEAKGGRVQ